jgi:drug/metabolite transporter (DMT)-like permease
MISAILSKMISESMLSLHPIMVKYINLDIITKLWDRAIIFIFASMFFIDWDFILNNLISYNVFLLTIVIIAHLYFTHRGFLLLESGVGYTLFYTYPIMIILLSGIKIDYKILLLLFLAVIGILLIYEDFNIIPENIKKEKVEEIKDELKDENKKNINEVMVENYKYEGIISVLLCAFTEALLYFIVNRIKTSNNWNQFFLSYFFSAIILTVYILYKYIKGSINVDTKFIDNFEKISFFNIMIGTIGHYLKYYSIYNLSPLFYSILSYFGIITAFIYGIVINNDKMTIRKTLGALFIVLANIIMLVLYKK